MNFGKTFFVPLLLAVAAGTPDIFAQNLGKPISTIDPLPDSASQTSQNERTPLPNLIILPWQTPSIDADLLRQTKAARIAALDIIKKTLAPNAVTLDTIAPKKQSMETARYMLKDVLADAAATQTTPLAIMPVWARIHDHDLFAVVTIDTSRNTLRSMIHRIFPRSRWEESARRKDFKTFFESGISEITTTLNLASLSNSTTSTEDISIAIRDQTASLRANEIDRSVLALILGSTLISDFTVINPLANELLTTIQRFYGNQVTHRKANRELITRFTYDKVPNKLTMPIKLNLTISAADGVFGQTLPWAWTELFTIDTKPDNTMDLKLSDRLSKELLTEKSALRRDELPQVVKIRGAWAYVDKGRAWGLQMNDRLVGTDNATALKGHVVAYFGPEMKLKSPRGWPIHEGAIVFIRKGQTTLKVGQTLTYDTMKVPTPWPPTSSTNKP